METQGPVRSIAAPLLLAGMMVAGAGCAGATRNVSVPAGQPLPHSLTVNVSAHVAPEPAQVVVRTRLEPDARNRNLTIEWWSKEGVGGSHSISLDGEKAAIRHDTAINSLVSGHYLVTATLTRNDRSEVRRTTKLMVVGENTRDADDTLWSGADDALFER